LNLAPGGHYPSTTTVTDWDGDSATGENVLIKDAGAFWGAGSPRYNGFNTILPPNSPSACADNNPSRHIVSASSYHSGGVTVSKLDGAVAFVSETVDCGDLTKKLNSVATGTPDTAKAYNGQQSIYGVWGAMGSIAGKESKSL
jgi:hypothetical protein